MKKIIFSVLLCWVSHVWCDTVSDALQAKLNAVRTMSATFHQVVNAKNRELSRSSGTMALSRPGHFRWQTEKPMEQWVIADGRHLSKGSAGYYGFCTEFGYLQAVERL